MIAIFISSTLSALRSHTSVVRVGEGPILWEHLPPTETKSHEGKAMSYA